VGEPGKAEPGGSEPEPATPWGEERNEFVVRAGVALAASVGAAVICVVLRRGFGAYDLVPFAFGSLPFGVWMAGVARVFRDVVHRPHGLTRLGATAALGLIGALVWTVVVTWLFGPWVAGFDLPVAWLWAVAGIAALMP
jgi:hypothetical protein